jgi:hypothetical protein
MTHIRVLTPSTFPPAVTRYVHMTVLAVRHEVTERPTVPGARRRFGRNDKSRTAHMKQLRERIESDDYAIDADKVAAAILRRLLEQPPQCS